MADLRALIELGAAQWRSGYWLGMRQPAFTVPLHLTRSNMKAATLRHFDEVLGVVVLPVHSVDSDDGMVAVVADHPLFGRVLRLTLALLIRMGMPVMGGVKVIGLSGERQIVVGLPAIASHIRAPEHALQWVCGLMNRLDAGQSLDLDGVKTEAQNLIRSYQALAPSGVNTLPFLKAAHDLGIPWQHLANNVYQFGWGHRSRWLDSAFTDQTSVISSGLARDKVACARVLRRAGLPVPKHQLARSAEHALKLAQVLGYPVVVKPANLDGGLGVMAGVRDSSALLAAYAAAAKLSQQVLVEQHVPGNDYRIRICTGQVIGAVIRQAAAVVGDGLSSVRSLIERTNHARAQKPMPMDVTVEHGHKPIQIDHEVRLWLAAQGLTLDSVPAQGQHVRLRGAANVSLGGTTWDVTAHAHPDNLELALKAVAALRLDVAGVDLLLPDIARSYKETGGFICEVNAKPQFSSGTAHRDILKRLLPHQGRIPVVGIRHGAVLTPVLDSMVQTLSAEGICVRLVTTPLDCQQALQCKETDAVVCQLLDHKLWPRDHSPVDRFQWLMVEHQAQMTMWAADQRQLLIPSMGAQPIIDELSHQLRLACLGKKGALDEQ